MNYSKLPSAFYRSPDVLSQARALVGKLLITQISGFFCSGRIVETEAYLGEIDKASHAYGGRMTKRTEAMYLEGGVSYIYLCYGLHHLINVVTGPADLPHAILIRAIEPIEGKEQMLSRTGKKLWHQSIGSGPGNVTKAMGLKKIHNALALDGNEVFLASDGWTCLPEAIKTTPRIGVAYAGEDASLPYRFVLAGHPQVSAPAFTKEMLRLP